MAVDSFDFDSSEPQASSDRARTGEVRVPLDAALEAAFAGFAREPGAARDDDARIIEEIHACGRYRVHGVLGRGGMGVVFDAFDLELERSVALKVLPQNDLAAQAARQRFFLEARMAASLEHPGICPLYDVSVLPSGRPVFSMRRVDGVTLRCRLDDGSSRTLREWLAIYSRVLYAIAHAHEKGVLHLDLKPSNIMIGRHGEVYVLDFGLSVMRHAVADQRAIGGGTRGYVAPEIAAGASPEVAADIHALGVILRELARADAAAGSSLMKAEVSALAADASAPDPVDRPVDVASLIDRLEGIVARDSERLQRAGVEAAVLEVRLAHERKRRRFILAASIVVVALIGGGLHFRNGLAVERAERRHVAESGLFSALAHAQGLLESGTETLDVATARHAEAIRLLEGALAATRDASASVRDGALARLDELRGRKHALDESIAARMREEAFVLEIERIRSQKSLGGDEEDEVAALRAAFLALGCDVFEREVSEVAATLRRTNVASVSQSALDEWTFAETHRSTPDPDVVRRLGAVAAAIDANAWRAKARTALLDRDVADARRIVEANGAKRDDLPYLVNLLNVIGHRDAKTAAAMAVDLRREHPEDFLAQFSCGYWCWRSGPEGLMDAAAAFTAAIALDPRGVAARVNLVNVLVDLDRFDDAMAEIDAALAIDEHCAQAWLVRAVVARRSGRTDEVVSAIDRAIALDPTLPEPWLERAEIAHRSGNEEEALEALSEGARHCARSFSIHMNRGLTLLKLDRLEEASDAFALAATIRPATIELLVAQATTATRRFRHTEAAEFWRRCVADRRSDDRHRVGMTTALLAARRFEEVVVATKRKTNEDRLDPALERDRLRALAGLGRWDDIETERQRGVDGGEAYFRDRGLDRLLELLDRRHRLGARLADVRRGAPIPSVSEALDWLEFAALVDDAEAEATLWLWLHEEAPDVVEQRTRIDPLRDVASARRAAARATSESEREKWRRLAATWSELAAKICSATDDASIGRTLRRRLEALDAEDGR